MRRSFGTPSVAFGALFALILAACGAAHVAPTTTAGPAATAPGTQAPVPTPAAVASVDPWPAIAQSYDVGGHTLYMICQGPGPVTVIYLHGISPQDSGINHASLIAANLRKDVRICRYDRANVGESGTVEGMQTAANAVSDLHELLFMAGITNRAHTNKVILLGASFGGLIAYEYAVTHPEDVAGMVVLDPTLPREYLDIDPFYHPDDGPLTGEEWKDHGNIEHMDWLRSMQETSILEGTEPKIPGTYFELVHPQTWWHPVTEQSLDAYRTMQQRFIDLWSPGLKVVVDTPHFMEPVIPDEIADAVRDVIVAAGVGG